jgi:nitrilase
MGMDERDKLSIAEKPGEGPIQNFLAEQSHHHKIWIVGGTVPLQADNNHVSSACLVFDDQGELKARYDKIHLFDVELRDSNESYNESETVKAGDETAWFDSPFGRVGLAICYDLRFPELFRQLVEQGVEIFAIPSAFTATTGRAHWETLIRARAIENHCYVVAANQGGYHVNGRETYGDSMIVDPWGNIMDRLQHGSGVVIADSDREKLASIRENFPSLKHRRI